MGRKQIAQADWARVGKRNEMIGGKFPCDFVAYQNKYALHVTLNAFMDF